MAFLCAGMMVCINVYAGHVEGEEPNAAHSHDRVLITGANRGIGLALAEHFLKAGFEVIGTARKPQKAEALVQLGVRVERLDVTDQSSVDALAQRLSGVDIDILINNAGVGGTNAKKMADIDIESMRWVLDVNTLGPTRVMQALFPNVLAGDRKVIANISSQMGSLEKNTWGCCAGYRASKSALNSINQTFAVDFADTGVAFVVFHPGSVKTDMNRGGSISTEESAAGLLKVISGLNASNNGDFLDWRGNPIPW